MNQSVKERCVLDHTGHHYATVLERLHKVLQPKSYLEIGVFTGQTLRLARCDSIAVDPQFKFDEANYVREVANKPALHLFQRSSDDFFGSRSPTNILGRPIDMAFLDGMHRCEYLLRDFLNTEKHCRQNSIIGMHDCLPVDPSMTTRLIGAEPSLAPHRRGWWTGDVWRTALLLHRMRPDLEMTALDAAPTGLILVTNLDPHHTAISCSYRQYVREMMSYDLANIGIQGFFDEIGIESTKVLATDDAITGRFWL